MVVNCHSCFQVDIVAAQTLWTAELILNLSQGAFLSTSYLFLAFHIFSPRIRQMIWLLGLLDDFQVDMLDLSKRIWSGQGGVSKKVGWEEMESGAKTYIHYSPENKHDIGKSPCLIGNTSSNGECSIAMFVFGGVLHDTPERWNMRCCNTTHPHECLVILKVHLGAHVLLNSRAAVVTKVPDRHGHLEAAGSMGCNGKNVKTG